MQAGGRGGAGRSARSCRGTKLLYVHKTRQTVRDFTSSSPSFLSVPVSVHHFPGKTLLKDVGISHPEALKRGALCLKHAKDGG